MRRNTIGGFEWDSRNSAKCQKHGVSLGEVEDVFVNALVEFPDPTHSEKEDRFILIGRNAEGRPIFVVFTLRQQDGQSFARPISARYMHQKEVQTYEKTFTKT